MNFLRSENIFPIFSPTHRFNEKRFISYHAKIQLAPKLRMFPYKKMNNFLYLNEELFIFNKKDSKLCFHYRLQDKITNHIFVEC